MHLEEAWYGLSYRIGISWRAVEGVEIDRVDFNVDSTEALGWNDFNQERLHSNALQPQLIYTPSIALQLCFGERKLAVDFNCLNCRFQPLQPRISTALLIL
jgi:hypothetical protein